MGRENRIVEFKPDFVSGDIEVELHPQAERDLTFPYLTKLQTAFNMEIPWDLRGSPETEVGKVAEIGVAGQLQLIGIVSGIRNWLDGKVVLVIEVKFMTLRHNCLRPLMDREKEAATWD